MGREGECYHVVAFCFLVLPEVLIVGRRETEGRVV